MSKITLGQAAKAGFASRAQIYRDAAGGKLAIEVRGDRKTVDLAELLRVYGDPGARPVPATSILAAPDLPARVELERKVAELETAKAAIEAELRAERTAARDAAAAAAADRAKLIELAELAQRQAGEAQKLLADARATAARPWWRKLLGRPAVLGVAVALLLTGGDAQTQARPLRTGSDLLPSCKDALVTDSNASLSTSAYSQGLCVGVVRAILNSALLLRPSNRFCPPSEVTYGQAVRVVVSHMERNPAELHLHLEWIALDALRKAWPCQN
jgi:hypothetical protein